MTSIPKPNTATNVQSDCTVLPIFFLCSVNTVSCPRNACNEDRKMPNATTSLHIHCTVGTTVLLCRQNRLSTLKTTHMSFVVIEKKVFFEEMVGKFNRFSDRVNEILSKREEVPAAGWTTRRSANSCASVRVPYRHYATTARWPTPKSATRFSISRKMCNVSSAL